MATEIQNINEDSIDLDIPGTQSANLTGLSLAKFPGVIRGISARLDTAGTTGIESVDVLIDGVSIFSGSVRIDFATASTTPTYGPLTTNPPKVLKNSRIVIKVITIHSGVAAKDLGVVLSVRRNRASLVGAMDTDTVSVRSDAI